MAKNNIMNDLFYGEMLSTPGYDVDFAVGMTYSMDLEALLTVPMAFGAFGELNETTQKSPLYLLEAVRKSAKKFLVFCNKGQIKVPRDCRKIYSMLEDSVCEVFSKPQEDGQHNAQFSNFHPKVWLIRETKREDRKVSQMRVVILSRNLTFDNSLDTAVALTGRIVTDRDVDSSKQQPLISMLNDLHKFVNSAKQWEKIEKNIIDGLNHVERLDVSEPFDDYDFIVYNPDGTVYTSIKENRFHIMQGLSSFIFSPFIDLDTLKWLTHYKPADRERVLVTRSKNLTKEILDYYSSIGGKIYTVKDGMLDKDVLADAGVDEKKGFIDLHAKMYFLLYPHNQIGSYLFMGSANATRTAFSLPDGSYKGHLNTEILIRLRYRSTYHFKENIHTEFLDEGPECKFELIDSTFVPSTETAPKYSESERLMRYIISGDMLKASCAKAEDGLYNVTITFKGTRLLGRHSCSVTLAPLQYPTLTRPLANGLVFEKLPVAGLSEFYILTVTNDNDTKDKKESVIKISTSGIPAERDEMIFRSFVDTEEKFLKYISLLLTDSPNLALSELGLVESNDESSGKKDGRKIAPQFYEQLLRIAATEPERLDDVNKVIGMIDSKTVPDSFWKMYNSFKSLSHKLKKL